jgi:hypothetical protein
VHDSLIAVAYQMHIGDWLEGERRLFRTLNEQYGEPSPRRHWVSDDTDIRVGRLPGYHDTRLQYLRLSYFQEHQPEFLDTVPDRLLALPVR